MVARCSSFVPRGDIPSPELLPSPTAADDLRARAHANPALFFPFPTACTVLTRLFLCGGAFSLPHSNVERSNVIYGLEMQRARSRSRGGVAVRPSTLPWRCAHRVLHTRVTGDVPSIFPKLREMKEGGISRNLCPGFSGGPHAEVFADRLWSPI